MIISIRDLYKQYGKKVAVNGISFDVKENRIFGLLGSNGAGKTTAINMMTGLIKPSSGIIRIFGKDLRKNLYDIRQKIGLVPQTISVYEDLTVYENLKFFGKLFIKGRQLDEKIEELIKLLSLPKTDILVKNLSGGYKRRVSFAVALINDPKVIFLDEPTTGIDIITNEIIMDFIMKRKKQSSIILTTHSITEAERVCDDIGIMHQGNMLIRGDVKSIIKKYSEEIGEKIILEFESENKAESAFDFLGKNKFKNTDWKKNHVIFYSEKKPLQKTQSLLNFLSRHKKYLPEDISLEKPSLEMLFKETLKKRSFEK